MAFRRSDLQEAFFVPGAYAFRVYGYGTTDPLEQVLAPGYFAHGTGLLRPGDLIYVAICPPQTRDGAAPGEPRMALVMARPDERNPARAAGSVRLVQDFGRASDPAGPHGPGAAPDASAPAPPARRGRGRPPGSKNKKPALTSASAGTPDPAFEAPVMFRERAGEIISDRVRAGPGARYGARRSRSPAAAGEIR